MNERLVFLREKQKELELELNLVKEELSKIDDTYKWKRTQGGRLIRVCRACDRSIEPHGHCWPCYNE